MSALKLTGRNHLMRAVAPMAVVALFLAGGTRSVAQDLSSFAILGGSTVTNTGPSVITGNLGVSPGSAVTGFPPGLVLNGTIHAADAVAGQAQSDLTVLYTLLAGRPTTADLTGQDLGGQTLGPGVYEFDTTAPLNGVLTLNAGGDPNAVFIFNIGSTLITGSNSSVALVNGAQGGNVYFVVGSSATLGSTTTLVGRILALTSISLNDSASITCGAALARNGAVTLINNVISIPDASCTIALPPGAFEDALDAGATENEAAVAAALDAFVEQGGTLPLAFQFLAGTLTPAELAAALSQLAGEAGTGTAEAGIQAMDSLLNLVGDAAFSSRRGRRPVRSPDAGEAGPPETVRVLGYMSDGKRSADDAFAVFNDRPDAARGIAPAVWHIWAAGFGGYRLADGDASVGSHDITSRDFGAATGFDYLVTPDTELGFAIAGGGTRFSVADGFGSGKTEMLQLAVYGRTDLDRVYLAAALAYAMHDASTDRDAIGEHLSADFIAQNFAGQVEAGYSFGWFTPYAALRGQAFYTPAYSESSNLDMSILALHYDAQTTTQLRSELGARIYWDFAIGDGAVFGVSGRAAWAHGFQSDRTTNAVFQVLPGAEFTVNGAELAENSLLVSAGADMWFGSGFGLAATFESELSNVSETYGGNARISYRW